MLKFKSKLNKDYKQLLIVFIFAIAVVYSLVVGLKLLSVHIPITVPQSATIEYRVVIVDEHEVRLINNVDTVTLYLENSYSLRREEVIFLKH